MTVLLHNPVNDESIVNKKYVNNFINNDFINYIIHTDTKKLLGKFTYELIVLVVLAGVGIHKTETTIRHWAAYQEAAMNLNGVLTKLKEWLQKLSQVKQEGKDGNDAAKAWLEKHLSEFKDDMKNLYYDDGHGVWDKDIYYIKDKKKVYIVHKGDKKNFLNEYKVALFNTGEVQDVDSDPTYSSINNMLKQVFGGETFPKSTDANCQGQDLPTILEQWFDHPEWKGLNDAMINIFTQAYSQSWNYNHSDPDKQKTYTDYLGNASSSEGMDAQLANGASNQSSTAVSENAQMLASFVEIGQQTTQSANQGKQQIVQNQKVV